MKVPNYLCNAAIILTASKLGLSVGLEDFETKILETKSMPETITIGFFSRQAYKAVELVNSKGLGSTADLMAENILKQYKWICKRYGCSGLVGDNAIVVTNFGYYR